MTGHHKVVKVMLTKNLKQTYLFTNCFLHLMHAARVGMELLNIGISLMEACPGIHSLFKFTVDNQSIFLFLQISLDGSACVCSLGLFLLGNSLICF